MKPKRTGILSAASAVCLLFFGACTLRKADIERRTTESEPMQKALSLEAYLEESDEAWFLSGKKEYALQAMMVSKETSFHNDLEETDYTVTDDGATVILRGTVGERWASPLSKVTMTYVKQDGSAITLEDFEVKDEFIDILSIPSPDSCWAMHVPLSYSVTVITAWNDILHTNLSSAPHGDGDYLICRFGPDGGPDLSDVWVLNGAVFPNTYDTSHESEQTQNKGS